MSSHAGENLFWMGRYAERTDNLARLLRTTLQCTTEGLSEQRGILRHISQICSRLGILMPRSEQAHPTLTALQQSLQAAVSDPSAMVSVATHLRHLHHSGYQVREHLSLDNWQALNRMPAMVQEKMNSPTATLQVLNNVIQACTGLAGHALDDMTRDEGWQFLMIGRHIERMVHLAHLFDQYLQLPPAAQDAALTWLLESSSSIVTYRVRYRRKPEWLQVLHLLIFDISNPHSIAYQFRMLQHYLADIAQQLGILSMNIPAHLSAQLDTFSLPDLARDSTEDPVGNAAEAANLSLMQLMRAASNAGYTLTDDLARHFFTPLSVPVSQGV